MNECKLMICGLGGYVDFVMFFVIVLEFVDVGVELLNLDRISFFN